MYVGSSTFDVGGNIESTTDNAGATTVNASTSIWQFEGNFALGTNTTWTRGTEDVKADGSGAQQITSAGETVYDIVVNKSGGTLSLADALTCNDFDIDDGAVTLAYDVEVEDDFLADCDDAVTSTAGITMSGASGEFHLGSSVSPTFTACTLKCNGTGNTVDLDAATTIHSISHDAAANRTTFTGSAAGTINAWSGEGDIVLNQAGSTTFGAAVKLDTVVLTTGTIGFGGAGNDSIDLYVDIDGGIYNCSADSQVIKAIDGTNCVVTTDAASLWKILDGGTITGFDGDTLPNTIFLGGGGF
jgi:hypothetical protein